MGNQNLIDRKEKIVQEFLSAMKNKDAVKKGILGVIRGEITTAEKNGVVMDNAEITKLLLKMKKGLVESLALRPDEKLSQELEIVDEFLPQAMTTVEIQQEVEILLKEIPESLPLQARVGKTIGMFNKKHQGRADAKEVKEIIEQMLK